ncbi:MAG: TetR family transcriptional regulator [Ruminococcaceae bacterium]|nr:TetR family transcriptional regulator [Oscillospiraceae bacterium]
MEATNKKGSDRRVRMTKMLLKQSLIELMHEKSIHEISIKDICTGADINRSTFYRHYNTQYELYDEVLEDITKDIGEIYLSCSGDDYTAQTFLAEILKYIEANRDTFLVILSGHGNVSMGETFNRFTSRFIDSENTSELRVYIIQFIAAGMTSFIWTWLNKENRRSAEDVALVISSVMTHGIKRSVNFARAMQERNNGSQ